MNLMQQLQDCWNAITRGHIFDSLTLMENAEYCEMMEKQAILSNSEDPIQKYLNNLERRV
jgi:rRNA processing protein Krr1/Pno1